MKPSGRFSWRFWVKALATGLLVAMFWPPVQAAIEHSLLVAGVPAPMVFSWILVLVDVTALIFWRKPPSTKRTQCFAGWILVLLIGVVLTWPTLGLVGIIYAIMRFVTIAILNEVDD